jgi:cation diffusion facilitator family transporter
LVDTANQGLLLHGLRRANLPPSKLFPFGHGKEVYFWSFVVAMLIFAMGGAFSVYQGIKHLADPSPINNVFINYIVLGSAVLFELGALWVALKEFNLSRGDTGVYEAIREGKDPTLFVVLFEDSAALIGLLVAMLGLALYQITGDPIYDAMASIVIGVVLIGTAYWLALESKNLLIGESAHPVIETSIEEIFAGDIRIDGVNDIATLHMGPEYILVTLSADFASGLGSDDLEKAVADLGDKVRGVDARIRRVFIEAKGKIS